MDEKIILLNKISNGETKCSIKGCTNNAFINVTLNSKKGNNYCEKHLDELKENFDEEYNNLKNIERINNKIEISTNETLYI